MVELRPYQIEARDAVLKEWNEGRRKTLLVLPTAAGKTIVFSSVINEAVKDGSRALVLAHRGELLDQAADKMKCSFGIDSAREKADSTALGSLLPVTVGSVQSMAQPKRLSQFPPDYYRTIVVDEAHHCLSDSYQRVLNHFPQANVLGVTATPDRGDMKSLGQYFDSLAYEYTMTRAIHEHYLVPVRAQMIPLSLDISKVGITNGDFAVGESADALEPYLKLIAQEMKTYCKGRKTVVFLPLVKTSRDFTEILNKAGFLAAEVDGNSSDRTRVLKDFEEGKYNVLCNAMLLTEGWDCPAVDCVVVLRPTKVRSLFQQMVGRGMRLSPGKKDLLLLDFLWLTEKHDLCRPSSLISKDAQMAERINRKIAEAGVPIDILDAEEEAERDAVAEREANLAKKLEEMRGRKRKLVDPLQYAVSIEAEDVMNYQPTFAWEMAPPTKAQLDFLEKRGIFADTVQNQGMASMLIDRLIRRQQDGLATPKQIRCLERYGFRRVGTWSFKEANRMISRISMNHWMVPYGMEPADYVPAGYIPA